jgi:hypothetical protein
MTGIKPKALFKYLHPSRITVLRDLLIRFSQASSLNDTLELRPPTKGVAQHDTLAKIGIEKLAPTMWADTSAINKKTQENRKILEKRCPGLPDLVAEILLQTTAQKFAKAVEARHQLNPHAVFDVTDKNFGILSLTETPTDVRMWGHYADGGRGFLIEFDPEHPWFHAKREERDSFRHMRQVNYVSSRPAKYLLDVTELEFLYTKWDVWRDEQEWRIIRSFNDAATKLDARDPYGNEILLFAIPPDSIKSIVVGFSASQEFKRNLRAIPSQNAALQSILFQRAIQSAETGEVEILSQDSETESTTNV